MNIHHTKVRLTKLNKNASLYYKSLGTKSLKFRGSVSRAHYLT